MKVLVIGGVASGTKVAAKLKREDRNIDVTILTKGKDISYAGCGLPYYVGNIIKEKSKLIVNTPEAFSNLTGAKVITETEVTKVDPKTKTVTSITLATGEETIHSYDKLVIASGASAVVPNMEGTNLKNVFVMRTPDDAISMREAVESGEIKRAVVVGAGFIGLEVAENLHAQGIKVTVIDFAPNIIANILDPEISEYLEIKMAEAGVMAMTNVALEGIAGEDKVEKVLTSKRAIKADACVLAMGIRPNTSFLQDSGIEMDRGVILTNANLETNIEDIYAVGDCAYVSNRLTSNKAWSPMGSTANIAGRVLAQNIVGKNQNYMGVLGTGIAKLPGDISVGSTGLTETAAKKLGIEAISATVIIDDKAHYYPGADSIIIKLVVDKSNNKIIGAQAVGKDAVDKVIDIVVTSISLRATIEQMQNLDFAYAPPFSTAIHPLSHTINVLINKMNGSLESISPAEFAEFDISGYKLIDVSLKPSGVGIPFVELTSIDENFDLCSKEDKILIICTKGRRAYMAQNRLKHYGFNNTVVLEAGTAFSEMNIKNKLS